jgi:catechol 2,3-dioxygenase-like lactoylglutathione lyase family enzyme
MIVKRIGYVGMRTEHLERMTWFFRDVLGLREATVGETFSILNLPTGAFDFAEVYTPGHHDQRMVPDGVEGPVVAFVVENLELALREVKEAASRSSATSCGLPRRLGRLRWKGSAGSFCVLRMDVCTSSNSRSIDTDGDRGGDLPHGPAP